MLSNCAGKIDNSEEPLTPDIFRRYIHEAIVSGDYYRCGSSFNEMMKKMHSRISKETGISIEIVRDKYQEYLYWLFDINKNKIPSWLK